MSSIDEEPPGQQSAAGCPAATERRRPAGPVRGTEAWNRAGFSITATLMAVVGAGLAACGGNSSGSSTDSPYAGTMTYWYWAQSDAPGANKWMTSMIAEYEKLHPQVTSTSCPRATPR